jgi:ABC-type transporter Mla MlaB component
MPNTVTPTAHTKVGLADERSHKGPPRERAETTATDAEAQRTRSMSVHPSLWNRQLFERVESLHRTVRDRYPSANDGHGAHDDEITLSFHGDLDTESVPHLRAVLDAVILLRPSHLSVDLSQVRHVSSTALWLIECAGKEIGGWSLLAPTPTALTDLIGLGCSDLVESECIRSATA